MFILCRIAHAQLIEIGLKKNFGLNGLLFFQFCYLVGLYFFKQGNNFGDTVTCKIVLKTNMKKNCDKIVDRDPA